MGGCSLSRSEVKCDLETCRNGNDFDKTSSFFDMDQVTKFFFFTQCRLYIFKEIDSPRGIPTLYNTVGTVAELGVVARGREWSLGAPLILSKRSATIGWRAAYKKFLGKNTS